MTEQEDLIREAESKIDATEANDLKRAADTFAMGGGDDALRAAATAYAVRRAEAFGTMGAADVLKSSLARVDMEWLRVAALRFVQASERWTTLEAEGQLRRAACCFGSELARYTEFPDDYAAHKVATTLRWIVEQPNGPW